MSEIKHKLTLTEKLTSWKRWMVALGAALPVFVEGFTNQLGWAPAIAMSVAALIAGVLGLAKEDSARLQAAATSLTAGFTNKEKEEELKEEEKSSSES